MDIRQCSVWGDYLSGIGWKIERVGKTQVFIRSIPLIKYSLIKIQHPQNPLPFLKIDQIAQKHHALFVLIEPEPHLYFEKFFLENGYQKSAISLTHTATVLIDLQKKERELFTSFSKNAQRNIKKALKNNLESKTVFLSKQNVREELEKFFPLIQNLAKEKKFHVPSFDELFKKLTALKEGSVLLFAYTKRDPQPVAAVWLYYQSEKMYYLHTGVTQEGYKLLANYLLVWEALKLGKKIRLKTFDFEGIFDPRFPKFRQSWKGLTEFKKRFHGTLVEYPTPWIKFYNPFFKLFYQCNQILTR